MNQEEEKTVYKSQNIMKNKSDTFLDKILKSGGKNNLQDKEESFKIGEPSFKKKDEF